MNGSAAMTTIILHAAAWEALLLVPRAPAAAPRALVSVAVVYRRPPPPVPAPAIAAPPAPKPAPRRARLRRRSAPKPKPVPVVHPPALLTAPAASAPAASAVQIASAPAAPTDAGLPVVSEQALPEGYVHESGFAFAPLYRVTQPPRLAKPLELSYPDRAREFQKEGVVILEVDIDAGGKVLSARVIEEPGWGFGEAALKAIRQAVFSPAKIGDTAVPVRYRLPIRFKMDFS